MGPCPLNRLDPAQIPASERFGWQPKELVAVIGTHRQRHWGTTYAVALRPDGKEVATAGQDGIRFWDAATLAPRGGPLGAAVKTLAYVAGADGPRLAIGSDRLHLTTRRSGPMQDGNVVLTTGTMIHTLAANAAGSRLAIAGEAGQIVVWDAHARKTVAVVKPAWPTVVSSQGCA